MIGHNPTNSAPRRYVRYQNAGFQDSAAERSCPLTSEMDAMHTSSVSRHVVWLCPISCAIVLHEAPHSPILVFRHPATLLVRGTDLVARRRCPTPTTGTHTRTRTHTHTQPTPLATQARLESFSVSWWLYLFLLSSLSHAYGCVYKAFTRK